MSEAVPSFIPEPVVAVQPRLWLWPRTIQKGWPVPLTETLSDVRLWCTTRTDGAVAEVPAGWEAVSSPALVNGRAAPPAAEPRANASTSRPAVR
jgi:hypothetical protein